MYICIPRTSITRAVNDRIRRRMRSYTVVYDRISPYYLAPELRPYLVVSYTTIVYDHRIRQYTVVYNIVCRRIRTSFSLVKGATSYKYPPSHPPNPLHPPPLPSPLFFPSPPVCPLTLTYRNTYRCLCH